MKKLLFACGVALVAAGTAHSVSVGQPAPAFAATDTGGKSVKLADFKGRFVVLEWNNPGCPYVRKHYDSRNMQSLQKEFGARNVVWLAINSTTPSHSDYLAPAALAEWIGKHGGTPRAVLMDPSGDIGRAYGARTTPHMYIIDPQGQLVYAGAIDDKRGTDPAEVKTATNYVKLALNEAMSGRPVSNPATNPYGCSVKY